jgi:3'(2'), 5'-bisphosphate nucleotidase
MLFMHFQYFCSMEMEQLLKLAQQAALEAGKAIMEVYAQPFEVYTKDDDSPVTQADLRASNIIKEILKPTDLPFVSEEDLPPDRSQYKRYWLVDPLDGTVEFVNRNGEFTVNIALIDDSQPVMGVIYAPVLDTIWYADGGYWTKDRGQKTQDRRRRTEDEKLLVLSPSSSVPRPFTVLVSRSHRTSEVDEYINKVLRPAHPDLVIDTQGSSLKFARLAEGSADVYVCYSKTKEWDTAAADAILRAAGGKVLRISDGQPLEYSKEDYPNPPFVAWAEER